MKNKYQILIDKMNRFNEWEEWYQQKMTVADRLKHFLILFDLGKYLPEDTIQRAREEHLKNLIEISKRLNVSRMRFENGRNR